MTGEMIFSMRDLYPNYIAQEEETSTKANPDADDQDALNEDTQITEKADTRNASRKNVLLALAVLVALVVFFGGRR